MNFKADQKQEAPAADEKKIRKLENELAQMTKKKNFWQIVSIILGVLFIASAALKIVLA